LKKLLLLSLLTLLLSCGEKNSTKTETNKAIEYSSQQLDSIGKNYTPQIGTYGGTVTVPLSADPDGFCPALSNSGYSHEVMGYIYEGLITTNPVTLEYEPHIAKSWSVSEDGLTWSFKLRDDIFFSDSVRLTSSDVLFTFNDVIYNKELRSPLNYNFRVDGEKIVVTAPDSFTVNFQLPKPFAPFLTVAGVSIMPRHKYAKFAKDGTLESELSSGASPEKVVGTGAFILEKVELGQRIILKRNPNYWKKDSAGNRLPYLDGINLMIVKEPNVQMMKFKAGELDQLSIMGEHYPMLKPNEKELNIQLFRVGASWYDPFFFFNQNNQKDNSGKPFLSPVKQSWFREKKFRQACAFGVNYNEIINIAYNGLAYPPAGIWGAHKGVFHNSNSKQYSFNPQLADSLLTSIGMIDRDGDGFREDSLGNILQFNLTTTAGVKLIENIYGIVRKDFEKIGLKLNLDFVEFNTLIARVNNTFDWDIAAFAMGGIRDPHFGKSSSTSSSFRYSINPQRKDDAGNNIPKSDRDWELRVGKIFEMAAMEMDLEKRKNLYYEWQEIEQEQCNSVYMPLKEVILGVQSRFGNIHLTKNLSLIGSVLHNIDEIFVIKKQ
jgi:peptide/nickel transport system substrate-binding protein